MSGYFDLRRGSALVTRAAEAGAAVPVTDLDGDAAARVADRLSASKGRAEAAVPYVSDASSAAKAGIIGFTKSLARAANMMNRIPMKRWAQPDEVAGAFVCTASDAASYITGQVLAVDGGMVM